MLGLPSPIWSLDHADPQFTKNNNDTSVYAKLVLCSQLNDRSGFWSRSIITILINFHDRLPIRQYLQPNENIYYVSCARGLMYL